jgi:2-iminobutanoate/2-iminopropanoate deaminase
MATSFNPPEVWQPFGAFALAAVQGEGRPVHLKGQVALDRDGRLVGKGGMRAQVRQVLENIRSVLASVGGQMGDIISLTQYTTDMTPSWRPVTSESSSSRSPIRSPRRYR